MDSYRRLLATVAAGAMIFGYAAFAQGDTGGATTGGGMSGGVSGGAVSGGAERMQGTSTVDVEALRAALTDLQAEIDKLESLSSVSTASTKYVDVTQVIQPTNQPGTTGGAQAEGATGGQTGGAAAERAQGMGLTGLVEQNQQQIVALHKAIQANGALMGALESQNIPIDNVVAVDISDNGQVTVYYADLEPPESEGLKQSQPEAIPLPETGGGNTGGATGGAQ